MRRFFIAAMSIVLCVALSACGSNEAVMSNPSSLSENSTATNDVISDEAKIPATTYDFDAVRDEAEEVFQAFLSAASQMENNSEFDAVFSYYEKMEDSYAQRYAEYYVGTEDEYKEKTPFEQFIWYELYINPVMYTTFDGYDTYFSDLARYQATVTATCYSTLKRQGNSGQEIADAYQSLMEWQYNFFVQHGSMYNFITEKTSAEENPNYVIPDPVRARAEQAAQEQQELQELRDELQKGN